MVCGIKKPIDNKNADVCLLRRQSSLQIRSVVLCECRFEGISTQKSQNCSSQSE